MLQVHTNPFSVSLRLDLLDSALLACDMSRGTTQLVPGTTSAANVTQTTGHATSTISDFVWPLVSFYSASVHERRAVTESGTTF